MTTTAAPAADPGDGPDRAALMAVTVYLAGGQAPRWELSAADAAQVGEVVRAHWEHPQAFARDRVLGFGPAAALTTWLHLPAVIGLDVSPIRDEEGQQQ